MEFDLRLGDSLDPATGMTTLADRSVDVVLTDPPYSSGTRKEGQKGVRKSMTREDDDGEWFDNDAMTVLGFAWMIRQVAVQWRRVLVPGGHALVFIDWRMYPHLAAAIETADLRHAGVVVWKKASFGMGSCFRNQHEFILHFTNGVGREPQRRDVGSVLEAAAVRDGDHPTEKPTQLLERLLEVVAPPGALVLDPFAGVGTTGIAAARLGRRFVGWEKEPRHHARAMQRIAAAREQLGLSFGGAA